MRPHSLKESDHKMATEKLAPKRIDGITLLIKHPSIPTVNYPINSTNNTDIQSINGQRSGSQNERDFSQGKVIRLQPNRERRYTVTSSDTLLVSQIRFYRTDMF